MKKLILCKLCLIVVSSLLIGQNAFSEETRLSEQKIKALRQSVEQSQINLRQQLDKLSPTVYLIAHSHVFVAGGEIIVSMGQEQTNLKFYLSLSDCNDALIRTALSDERAFSVTNDQGRVRAEAFIEREIDFKNYVMLQCMEVTHGT